MIFKKLRSLIATDKEVRKALAEEETKRMQLDERLEKLSIATLDGEWDWWWLEELKRKDASCVLKIADECMSKSSKEET